MHKVTKIKLLTGVAILCSFIVVSLFGPLFAPYDVDYSKKIGYIQTVDGEQMVSSPFPPSKDFIFGTDKWGYDLLTLMLNGAKYTVIGTIIIAFFRVVIGCCTGILSGLREKADTLNKNPITIWSSIPTFIIIYFIMIGININSIIPQWGLILIQSLLMIILGISGIHKVVFSKTIEFNKELYVMASHSFGATKWHIFIKHIFPALRSNLMILLVNEAILVLHLIGQLGIFDLFFGGTVLQTSPLIYLSATHEWSGLIGQARGYVYHSQWIILFPLLAYMLYLFSFYLISAGMNDVEKLRTRKVSLL